MFVVISMAVSAVPRCRASRYVFRVYYYYYYCGSGSSVDIETDYGLDGPGSNPGGDEIFRPSRPALGPTQPLGLYRGKVRPGRAADHLPPSSAAIKKE